MTGKRIAVMGSGAWGSAFAMILCDAGNEVTMWSRRPGLAREITQEHRNRQYLGEIMLPKQLRATADARQAMDGAELVVLAVPSQQLRANLECWELPVGSVVVSLAKGIEERTGLRMSEVVEECGVARERIAVVSGPNLAGEIAQRQPAASVVAAADERVAVAVQGVCMTAHFRAYTITDVIGCELAGATKNAIALAVGMGLGLGLGANSMAALITRGLAETARLGERLGADPHTFAGLAGMGDLVATCNSGLSRNRSFGELLGRGYSVEEATRTSRGITEGVRSSPSIAQLAVRHGVDMPIVHGVVEVISGRLAPSAAIRTLMARVAKPERW